MRANYPMMLSEFQWHYCTVHRPFHSQISSNISNTNRTYVKPFTERFTWILSETLVCFENEFFPDSHVTRKLTSLTDKYNRDYCNDSSLQPVVWWRLGIAGTTLSMFARKHLYLSGWNRTLVGGIRHGMRPGHVRWHTTSLWTITDHYVTRNGSPWDGDVSWPAQSALSLVRLPASNSF